MVSMVLQGDAEGFERLLRDVLAGETLTVAGSLPVASMLRPIQEKNERAILRVLSFTGKFFAKSGTFWDMVRFLFEPGRRIRQ